NQHGVRTGSHGMTNLMLSDANAVVREVPLIARVSPQVDGSVQVVYGDRNVATRYRGVAPTYLDIRRWQLASGALFDDADVERAARVCLLGETVRAQLFGTADPVGAVIRVGRQPYRVVGLLAPKGQSATGQDQDDTIWVPYTTALTKLRGGGSPWV